VARVLSFSEIDTALACFARWDFAYGGRLAGSTLKAKELAVGLSEGRAWGAGVAAWHQHADELTALWDGHGAIHESLAEDAAAMKEAGFEPDVGQRRETEAKLSGMLDHYATLADPLPGLERLEGLVEVPILSRSGTGRASTRYRFQCYLDGATGDGWLVEFKLRGRLTDPKLMELQRQQRWYAWAEMVRRGRPPVGIWIDERLNELPKEPRILKSGKPSHAKDQLTTPEAYSDLCHEKNELPKLEVVEHLRQRQWQQRFPLMLRPGELDEAGEELIGAAKLINQLDHGEMPPIRNAKRQVCSFCRFKDVCANPGDSTYVETLFNRTVPKRLRGPKEEAVAA
jgi:hypothetical protein